MGLVSARWSDEILDEVIKALERAARGGCSRGTILGASPGFMGGDTSSERGKFGHGCRFPFRVAARGP